LRPNKVRSFLVVCKARPPHKLREALPTPCNYVLVMYLILLSSYPSPSSYSSKLHRSLISSDYPFPLF
jgi:hypothetical protein